MFSLADLWLARARREDLLREAARERYASELRATRLPAGDGEARASKRTDVRAAHVRDAPRIATLLELNGAPRWVAFEERFVVAEQGGRIVAALRFREEPGRLHLGLLVADPWVGERVAAVALYAGARVLARGLGLREIRARTRRHETYPREAGYRRWGAGWRLDLDDPVR